MWRKRSLIAGKRHGIEGPPTFLRPVVREGERYGLDLTPDTFFRFSSKRLGLKSILEPYGNGDPPPIYHSRDKAACNRSASADFSA
jgi:hypothetical protein